MSNSSTVRPIITKEENSSRKSHRVDIPVFAEFNGQQYKAQDWSVTGIGFRLFDKTIKQGDKVSVNLTLPMPDSSMQLNVDMVCRHKRENHFGFEFVNMNDRQRRILRHYVEMAVEGRLDHADDLVAISTTPVLNSPLQEALAFSEADQAQVDKNFKSNTKKLFAMAALFVVGLCVSIFYTQVYQIEKIGIATGSIASVESGLTGRVSAVFVEDLQSVSKGDPLFSMDTRILDLQMQQVKASINRVISQIEGGEQAQEALTTGMSAELAVMAAKQLKERRKRDLDRAQSLFAKRLINNKDVSYLENQLLQATLSYERELQKVRASAGLAANSAGSGVEMMQLGTKLDELQSKLAVLEAQRDNLVVRAAADGTVEGLNIEAGDMISQGHSVATLKQNTAPAVSIQVEAEEALKLHVGMEAKVYSALLDRHFKGHVTDIGLSAFEQGADTMRELQSPNTLVKIEFSDQNIRLPENSRLKVWLKSFSV